MAAFSTAPGAPSTARSGRQIASLSSAVPPDDPGITLPSLPTGTFVGRTRELAYVLSTIEQRSTQLLTILGPGGVGKTRLAVTAAQELSSQFQDGVFFIQFGVDPENVWEVIGHRLSVSHAAGEQWSVAVRNALRLRKVLLVLDNCEQVIEGFTELPEVLGACPYVTVLATSQEALRLRGEQELWLEPLALPEDRAGSSTSGLERSSAVELFALRARKVDPNFEITDHNAHDVAAVVRMLDGLPLAIELAGAQMRHLSPAALRQRLGNALPSLSGGSRDLPERQRSLMNVAAWSLNLLSPKERERFLQLAVLVGDFTPETGWRGSHRLMAGRCSSPTPTRACSSGCPMRISRRPGFSCSRPYTRWRFICCSNGPMYTLVRACDMQECISTSHARPSSIGTILSNCIGFSAWRWNTPTFRPSSSGR